MSLVNRIAGRLGYVRQSVTDRLLRLLLGGMQTKAGVEMTPLIALQVATVLACVRVIAEGVAALPARLRQRIPNGAEDNTTADAAWLLEEPNGWMTWQELVETLTMHAALTGNGFALIQRGVRGQPIALLPVLPGWVSWKQGSDWSITYRVTWPDGRQQDVGFADMFHLRGPSWDAVSGLSVVRLARESIGLAAAIEWTQAGHFGKGGAPSGALSLDQKVTQPQAEELQKRWAEAHGGQNSGKIAVLGLGAKFQPITLDFAGAQTMETRRLQVEEICRAFRVFPQMIGASDKATTYASAEAFFTAHAVHTLGPWVVRWEKTLARDLLTSRQRGTMFFKVNLTAMLRADAKSRGEFYTRAIAAGWMTRNEARQLEDLNTLPGLDVPLSPMNMQPGDVAPAEPTPPAAAA